MYLKRIEMFGFKSFAQSTPLEFNPGITSIVGPNGCGKSNVADALRWVMGIQAPKALRGRRMEDIIFNGTKIHRPLGMCEVSITLGDDGELLKTPFGSFSEVVVTRRLHRSGESECFLNNMPCRLRDLTDMFLDIGIGSGYLEVIEQGRLSRVIDASPQERRVVLEEAAGILKYKERRNEALRKLEASEQNLARVNDIIGELERQVRSLRRQALKAERYRRHRETLRRLEVAILAADHRKFQARRAALEERQREAAEEEAALSAQVTTLDNEISLCRVSQTDTERALQASRTRQLQVEHEIDKHKSVIAHLTERLGALEGETERSSRDIAQWSEELASIQRAAEELGTESQECEAALRAQARVAEQCRARLAAATEELAAGESVLRERKGAVIDVLSDIAACRNALTAAQTRMEQARRALERVGAERAEEEKSRESSTGRLRETTQTLAEHREALSRLAGEKERASAQMKECLAELARSEAARSDLQGAVAEKTSLLNSLEEMQRNLVGVQDGPRAVLTRREEEGLLSGVRELVADVLQTDAEYEAAIESVLGGRLQALIVERPADGVAAVRFLQEQGLGRAECVPLEPKELFRNPPPINGTPGILARASDVVRAPEPYQQVMEFLLRDVFIAEDVAAARSILEGNGAREYTLVTLDGTVVRTDGVVWGGAASDQGMLKTRRMIGLLRQERSALDEELRSRTREVASLSERRRGCEQHLEALTEEEHTLEKAILQSESQLCHLRESLEKTESKQLALHLDEAALQHEMAECADEMKQIEKELATHTQRQEEVDKEIQQLQGTLESQGASIGALKDEITRHEIELTRLRGTQDRVAREMARLESDEAATGRRIAARQHEREEAAGTTMELREQVEAARASIAVLSEERETTGAEVTEKERELRQHESTLVERESVARTLRTHLKGLQENLQQLLIERTEVNVQMEHLERVAQESHQISLEEVLAEAPAEGDDTDALREKARAVRSKVESMGNINLAAQEEYDEIKERYTFLTEQRDDLTASIASLREAIAQINRTTTKRFAETFHAVDEHFQESCKRIFGGGEASLILTDPDDMLETGVDISVQPPGKQVRNISLLSVGEKVLASAALLFAVFRVRPSPFYFIDEMDAPLDEANTKRFLELIKDLAGNSQFILVTHNKATMEVSDTLYGITMEEEGISKTISVHFNERSREPAVQALAEN